MKIMQKMLMSYQHQHFVITERKYLFYVYMINGVQIFSFWLLFLFSKEKSNYARYSLREAGTFSTSTEIVIVKLTFLASRRGFTAFANFSRPSISS